MRLKRHQLPFCVNVLRSLKIYDGADRSKLKEIFEIKRWLVAVFLVDYRRLKYSSI